LERDLHERYDAPLGIVNARAGPSGIIVCMSAESSIVAVLLAAGAGTRFGGGKLLHPLNDGVAVAAHAARNLLGAHLSVIAVVRAGDDAVARLLEQENCRVTFCADAVHGMGHTLAHGVAHASDASAWVIALADMPRVQPRTIIAIAAALRSGAKIAVPFYEGRRGHPVGFASALGPELRALRGDTGAREVLERHRDAIVRVACDDPGVLLDVDTKNDLHGLD
jgi:molybdenum cofactor cytidylyltransferase